MTSDPYFYAQLAEAGMTQADYDQTVRVATEGAHRGDPEWMIHLAVLAKVRGDIPTAYAWYSRAADAGRTDVLHTLGMIAYHTGDRERAAAWLEEAVAIGDSAAKFSLALLIIERGDHQQGRKLLRDAADSGNADAMHLLGKAASGGSFHEVLAEGVHWHTKAANAGHTGSMMVLGNVAKTTGNPETALEWYAKAAEGGDAEAAKAIEDVRTEALRSRSFGRRLWDRIR